MSEFRQDPLTGRWVIIGRERAGRPNEFVEQAVRYSASACPFCAGNEQETPPAVVTYPATGPWQVRVIPNKYPAVSLDDAEDLADTAGQRAGNLAAGSLFQPQNGRGIHEVIVESPDHVASLTELTPQQLELIFRSYRDRLRALRAAGDCRYVQIFKNVGAAAGASLEHAHSQLIGVPLVPETVERHLAHFAAAEKTSGQPLLEGIIEEELRDGQRIIAESAHLVAFCPWASRFAYQVSLAPKIRQASLESLEDAQLSETAQLVGDVIGRIERALGRPAYNLYLYTEPFDSRQRDHYHWHIEIFPRVTKTAGFEWSTDCFINPVPPETAAETLRAAERV